MMKNKKTGLYVHIPFCVKKCNYCDFLSFPSENANGSDMRMQYLKVLKRELQMQKERMSELFNNIDTVYIGGGTPSILSEVEMDELLFGLSESVGGFSKDMEVTMECNPGTMSENKMRHIYRSGVNRISMGMQSTDNTELALLGRIHTYETFLKNYELARKSGFENISIDLMSAIPNQTIESYEKSLKRVLSLEPEHISSYSLIIEEGTPFYDLYKDSPPVDEDTDRKMYDMTREILKDAGYERYEISNYAKSEKESRHNVKYWSRAPYLGIGLGAASFYNHTRTYNVSDFESYKEKVMSGQAPCEMEERLTKEDEMAEFMFLGLRLMKGISADEFSQEFSTGLEEKYGEIIRYHIENGFLQQEKDRIFLTPAGIDVSNHIFSDFL